MRKTRILFLITSSDFGGVESLLRQHIARLDKIHYESLLCSIKPTGLMGRMLMEEGIRVESLELDIKNAWKSPWKTIKKILLLNQLIKSFQPDVLHASLFQADVLGTIFGAWNHVPARIVTVQMVLRNKWPELLVERIVAPWMTWVVAASEDIRSFYVSRLLLPAKKISVIYNAVDEVEVVQKSLAPIKKEGLLGSGLPLLCMVGRLDNQKGLDILLRAFQQLMREKFNVGLLIVGEGPERCRLESLARTLGIDSHVNFLGLQKNPMPFLAASQVLVLSSHEEGLPLVILEAMALSKPVIATRVGAVPEAVTHQVTGLLVPKGNPRALAEAIREIISNPGVARKMGEQGRQRLEANFSAPQAQRHLETLYQRLLGSASE